MQAAAGGEFYRENPTVVSVRCDVAARKAFSGIMNPFRRDPFRVMTVPPSPEHDQQLAHDAHQRGAARLPFVMLAHDLSTPENVGSLFRIADAFGVSHLYLSGASVVPPNTKIRRVARATEQHVPWSQEEPLALLARLKAEGYTCVCLEITHRSIDLASYRIPKNAKLCLVVGAEKHGVPDTLLAQCEVALHIPMRGANSSMNVATACGVAAYVLSQQLAQAS